MKHPIAKMYTDYGIITIKLYPEFAPNAVKSFIWMANQKLYKDRLIKRIVPGFVIQPSYTFFDDYRCNFMIEGEFKNNGIENDLKMEKWTVALAGDGDKEASGSEFFITLTDETGAKLQDKFTAFGKVIDGFDEVERLANIQLKEVNPDGVNAKILQPVNDEYMRDIIVDTFGEEYPKPDIKYWNK